MHKRMFVTLVSIATALLLTTTASAANDNPDTGEVSVAPTAAVAIITTGIALLSKKSKQ